MCENIWLVILMYFDFVAWKENKLHELLLSVLFYPLLLVKIMFYCGIDNLIC